MGRPMIDRTGPEHEEFLTQLQMELGQLEREYPEMQAVADVVRAHLMACGRLKPDPPRTERRKRR